MCLDEETGDLLSFSQLESLEWAELENVSAIVGKMATRCAELFDIGLMANRFRRPLKDSTLHRLSLHEDHGATVDPPTDPPADQSAQALTSSLSASDIT